MALPGSQGAFKPVLAQYNTAVHTASARPIASSENQWHRHPSLLSQRDSRKSISLLSISLSRFHPPLHLPLVLALTRSCVRPLILVSTPPQTLALTLTLIPT